MAASNIFLLFVTARYVIPSLPTVDLKTIRNEIKNQTPLQQVSVDRQRLIKSRRQEETQG